MLSHHVANYAFCAIVATLWVWPSAHAEVYKWVDEKGLTHYSERKSDAGSNKASPVKMPPLPAPSQTSTPSTDYLRAPSKFAPPSPPLTQQADKPKVPSLSGGREDGSDASRCALARDVLSGSIRHGNGKPTDKYDRDVAQNDIKAFCR